MTSPHPRCMLCDEPSTTIVDHICGPCAAWGPGWAFSRQQAMPSTAQTAYVPYVAAIRRTLRWRGEGWAPRTVRMEVTDPWTTEGADYTEL